MNDPNLPADTGRYFRDLTERVVWTFVQAFLGTLVAANFFDVAHIRDTSVLQAAGVSAIAAVLAVIKGAVAKFVNRPDSASTAPGV